MNITDLKIGNYVLDINNKIRIITGINIQQNGKKFLILDFENKIYPINTVYPIQLTDDWIDEFDFTRGGYDMLEVIHNVYPRIHLIGYLSNKPEDDYLGYNYNLSDYSEGNVTDSCIQIKYVHQLQNLFSSLIGDELVRTIEEPLF